MATLDAARQAAHRWLTARDQYVLALWSFVRLFTLLWAALVSATAPMLPREEAINAWPPAAPPGAWLERVLLAPWERQDVHRFIQIVSEGYSATNGTAQFHPLLPWLATPLAWLGLSPLLALLLVSSLASALLLLVFDRLARLDLPPDQAETSTLLLLTAPPAFILLAPYTESLFLLWAVLCLFWARQERWWLAGLAGALATLTRQQGIFLLLPLAWELWEAAGRNWRVALGRWRDWLAPGLIPLALLGWIIYRGLALGDFDPDLSSVQGFIYSVLISSSANQVVPQQAFLWPWQAIWLSLTAIWAEPEYRNILDLVLGAGFVLLLVLAWRQLRISYRLYAVVIVLVSFSYNTGEVFPYMGLARHLLLAFPVFIGLAPVVQQRSARLGLLLLGSFGLAFLLFVFVLRSWVP